MVNFLKQSAIIIIYGLAYHLASSILHVSVNTLVGFGTGTVLYYIYSLENKLYKGGVIK